MRLKRLILEAVIFGLGSASVIAAQPASDAEIRQAIIQESLAAYPGPCPCPYNIMRNGRRCGANSAYSKPGGYSPVCFAENITKQMVDDYRRRHQGG
jgi:choline dehydrogenase-like flavoprotein